MAQVPVVAIVNVGLGADGKLHCHFEGPNTTILLGMLEQAKQLILAKQQEQAKAPKLMLHDPAAVPHVNGTRQG